MSALHKAGVFTVLTLSSVYAYIALRGPQGLPVLQEKWQEIREMQQHNADLKRDVDARAERIRRLKESPAEQELKIRERLKMLRPGETIFIIPKKP
ncbi:MAG TPA: septum formation initiator family protein [Bryobacteraceae bacterium]|nr:septum formation initiator family protein [Bryobacteraceae bacterium]